MIQRPPAKSLYRLVSRAQLDAVERLETQFPDVPWHVIYEKVTHARIPAAKQLPDLAGYADILEQHARAALVVASTASPTEQV